MNNMKYAVLLLAVTLWSTGECPAQETTTQQYVVTVERIWDRAAHSAFTDIVRYEDRLYCTFREGSGHIPGRNGLVRVIRSHDGMNWDSVALLDEPHVDLRDPKLSVTSDGRLMVNMGASYYHDTQRVGIESRVSFFDSESNSFGDPIKVVLPKEALTGFDWLWRLTWHDGWGWGCVQQVPNEGDRALQLVRSRDGIHFEYVTTLDVTFPSETTLRFLEDNTLLAMTRRSGGDSLGWIGTAKPPYEDWTFQPSNKRFGGPNLVQLPHGSWLAGSRGYGGKEATTALWKFDPEAAKFTDLLTLPSGGDTSYPGFVIDEKHNRVLVSYYSSHEGKGSIYLATLRLDVLEGEEK